MLKVLCFDLGHTILDERVGQETGSGVYPAIPMPGVIEVLPKIELPMAVWANTRSATALDVKEWLSRASLDRYFRWIVASADLGYRKPDPRFFAMALQERGCNADEVLFVGNQRNSDIKGANACGIRSVFLTGAAHRSDDDVFDPTAIPTYTIEHLGELAGLLAKHWAEI